MTFAEGPSRRSSLLGDIFASDVVAIACRADGRAAWLLADERACVVKAAPKRVNEFAAGRLCARHGLALLGVEGFALVSDAERCPVWPQGFTGSITHTKGFCAAVVARSDRVAGLGVDAETADGAGAHLWPRICTPGELAWLDTLAAGERPAMAALLFSAKEAFYKFQYPLTRQWLGFQDVEIRPGDGRFAVVVHKALPRVAVEALDCRYAFRDGLVVTGVAAMR